MAPGFSGNALVPAGFGFVLQVIKDLLITIGSSMQAMTFMAPPQPLQVSMSILKTRLSRCAHVIDARVVLVLPVHQPP
ncbi:Uncharacterised protein [Escherichia coli]|nr:Uncharacterised protein [Escherichia coli]